MPSDKKQLGVFGEDAACRWLRRHGYRILDRNFTCRQGELDIVARKRDTIAFVEVKLRKDASHGEAREFVTQSKQRRVMTAAQFWLMKHPTECGLRFDVIEVYAPQGLDTKYPEINHIEDAFE